MIGESPKKNVVIAIKNPVTLLGTKQITFLSSPECRIYSDNETLNNALFTVDELSANLLVTDSVYNKENQSNDVEILFLLCKRNPQLKVIVYADFITSEINALLKKNTQVSLLSRNNSLKDVYNTFSVALSGGVNSSFGYDSLSFSSKKVTSSEELTRCQKLTLLHFLDGRSQYEISRLLSRSNKTVSSHKCSAMRKLGLKNDAELFLKKNEILLKLAK